MKPDPHPIVVIGGGFYGCSIAEFLASRGARVLLIERERELLGRSSYVNQARLHGGYHYPRSFGTAYRSRLNFPRFLRDYREAIATDFVALYAIARANSKVSARQFETFCRNIEAPIRRAGNRYARLFNPHLVEAVYQVEEYVFDAAVLRHVLAERLRRAGVDVRTGCAATGVWQPERNAIEVAFADGSAVVASRVFNCSYSGLNALRGVRPTINRLKHEITEMALVELPAELSGISITLMDGPFFSFMPFPDRKLSTLSHVRYTPHARWLEHTEGVLDPYATLELFEKRTRFPHMARDAMHYVPAVGGMIYRDSLFEVKTTLLRNETDDGRPILFETSGTGHRITAVLGSKLDNVYDALAAVELLLSEADVQDESAMRVEGPEIHRR